MAEAPTLQAAVGRFPAPQENLAAWGLIIGLSLLIESPVILLLTTTIALVRDRVSFRALQRFMLLLAFGCTLLTGLIAFTPLFELVTRQLMEQPQEIAARGRLPLMVMLLWSALIAWRRFYQGVLVRFGQSQWMTWGTALRLLAIAVVAWYFAKDGAARTWPTGALTAAFAIMAGVLVEAVASTVFAKRTVSQLPETGEPLSQATIFRFHLPLALNTLLSLLAQPLTAAALARLSAPQASLAAWPVTFGVLLVMRGWSLALQELTVARLKAGETPETLRRFTLLVGILTSLATLLLVLTPALNLYLSTLHAPQPLWPLVRKGVVLCVPLPLLTSLGSFLRGTLVARGKTTSTLTGMALALSAQCLALLLAIFFKAPPMASAAIALLASQLAELLFLSSQSLGRRSSNAPS